VPRDATAEETAAQIAASLDNATREADRHTGITPPDLWTRPAVPEKAGEKG
jgi:hypothetical protein